VQANRETRREARFLDKGDPVARRASKVTSLSEVAGQPKGGNIGVTFWLLDTPKPMLYSFMISVCTKQRSSLETTSRESSRGGVKSDEG